MTKLTEKSRKVLRRIYTVLGASAISVLFAACYGMPMDYWCNNEDCTCEDCWDGDCECTEDTSDEDSDEDSVSDA